MNGEYESMHDGPCRPIVGQRNSTCAFCFCESSWACGGIATCWSCAREIVKKFWNDRVNPPHVPVGE